MLYARDVIDLLGAYPGRDWKMVEIVRHVSRGIEMNERQKRSIRKAVLRVMQALQSSGLVLVRPPTAARGGFAHYRWKSET